MLAMQCSFFEEEIRPISIFIQWHGKRVYQTYAMSTLTWNYIINSRNDFYTWIIIQRSRGHFLSNNAICKIMEVTTVTFRSTNLNLRGSDSLWLTIFSFDNLNILFKLLTFREKWKKMIIIWLSHSISC